MHPQVNGPGGDHFTAVDRERIITTSVDLKNLRDDFVDLKKSLYDGDNRFTTLVSAQGTRFEGLVNAQGNRFEGLVNAQGNRFESLLNAQQTKFEGLLAKIDQKVDQQAKEHDGRLRVLENFRWWILGAAAASGFGGSFLARFLHP